MNRRLSFTTATLCMALLSACQTNAYGTMVCREVYMTDGTRKGRPFVSHIVAVEKGS